MLRISWTKLVSWEEEARLLVGVEQNVKILMVGRAHSTNGNHRSKMRWKSASAPDSGDFRWQAKPDQPQPEGLKDPFKYEKVLSKISTASSW